MAGNGTQWQNTSWAAHGSVLDPRHHEIFFSSHENLYTNVCNSLIRHSKSLGRIQTQGADNQRNCRAFTLQKTKNDGVTDEQCLTHWAAWMRVQRIMQSGKGQFQGLTCCVTPFIKHLWNNIITETENKLVIDGKGEGVAMKGSHEESLCWWKCSMTSLYQGQCLGYGVFYHFCKRLTPGKSGKRHGDLHTLSVLTVYRSIMAK